MEFFYLHHIRSCACSPRTSCTGKHDHCTAPPKDPNSNQSDGDLTRHPRRAETGIFVEKSNDRCNLCRGCPATPSAPTSLLDMGVEAVSATGAMMLLFLTLTVRPLPPTRSPTYRKDLIGALRSRGGSPPDCRKDPSDCGKNPIDAPGSRWGSSRWMGPQLTWSHGPNPDRRRNTSTVLRPGTRRGRWWGRRRKGRREV